MIALEPLRTSPSTTSFRAGPVTVEASERPWDAATTDSAPWDQSSASTANTFPRDKPNRGTLLLASQRDAPRLQARTRAHDTLPDDWTCAPSCCGYAPEGFTKHHILPCRTGQNQKPRNARHYPTRHRVTKPEPRQVRRTHQEFRVGPRGRSQALDASQTSPRCRICPTRCTHFSERPACTRPRTTGIRHGR